MHILKDNASKFREELYLSALEIDDKTERQNCVRVIPTLNEILEKGLQEVEDELAEELDHSFKLVNG